MKFNLKNRPKDDVPYKRYAIQANEWFEGFEKELRERIMDISCGTKPNRTECWTIKEILGPEGPAEAGE